MRDPCSIVEETIWDCAREGVELPEETSRHVSSCESCARTLRLAGPALCLLQEAGRVETAVDRSVIMGRLTRRRARAVPVWGIGLAVMTLFVLAVIGLKVATTRQSLPVSAPIVVRRSAPSTPNLQPGAPDRLASNPTRAPRKAALGQRPHIQRLRRPPTKWIAAGPREVHRAKDPTIVSKLPDQLVEDRIDEHPVGRQPIAAVCVTWSAPPENRDISYHYHDTDPNTGEVTEGTVNRTGNIIEIRLESKPEKAPDKGEIKNETHTSI